MKTIAILNLKGGVAKTTTAINMSAILAGDYKQRVLLVDADSQCNTTEFFGGDSAMGNLARVLRYKSDAGEYGLSCIQGTQYSNLDLLAGSDELMDLDLSKFNGHEVRAEALRDVVEASAEMDLYDYVIVDCPPAFGAATAAALVAAQEVIIPLTLDAWSIRGMANLMHQVTNMRRINPILRVGGILITSWRKSDRLIESEQTIRASAIPVYKCKIRRSEKAVDMTYAQIPLRLFSPRCAPGVDYRRWVHEYLGGEHGE